MQRSPSTPLRCSFDVPSMFSLPTLPVCRTSAVCMRLFGSPPECARALSRTRASERRVGQASLPKRKSRCEKARGSCCLGNYLGYHIDKSIHPRPASPIRGGPLLLRRPECISIADSVPLVLDTRQPPPAPPCIDLNVSTSTFASPRKISNHILPSAAPSSLYS